MGKWFKVVTALFMLASLLLGCSSSPETKGGQESAFPAKQGTETTVENKLRTPADTLVFYSAEGLTGQWDPMQHAILGQYRLESLIFNRLFDAKGEESAPDQLEPSLALSAKQIDDRTIEYKLREGVTFQDGSEFTAEDVKATFEYASQTGKVAAGNLPGVISGKVIDKHTVQLSTDKPNGSLWFSAAYIPIVSKKDIEAGTLGQKPNGTGPFSLQKQEGETTILDRNESYWGGSPKMKHVHWKYVPDASTRLLALKAGEADIIDRVEPEQAADLEVSSYADVQKTKTPEHKWLMFKGSKAPFKDNQKLRQAIAYALDRELILQLMGNAGVPAKNFVAPAKFGYSDMDYPYAYNLEKAKQLLAEAGYPNGEGLPELEYITSTGLYPKTKEYGELIVAMLSQVGVKAKLTVLEPAAWVERIFKPDAGDMLDAGYMTGNPEPDLVIRSLFYSKHAIGTFFNDPELDAALDREAGITDKEERKKVLQTETFPLLYEKLPAIPLFNTVMLTGVRKEVKGFKIYPTVITVDILEATKE